MADFDQVGYAENSNEIDKDRDSQTEPPVGCAGVPDMAGVRGELEDDRRKGAQADLNP